MCVLRTMLGTITLPVNRCGQCFAHFAAALTLDHA